MATLHVKTGDGRVSTVRLIKVSPAVINVPHVSMGGTTTERRSVLDALLVSEMPGERAEYLVARTYGPDWSTWREIANYVEGEADPAGYDFHSLGRGPVPIRLQRFINGQMAALQSATEER
jgi:hypothetical protein